MLPRPRHWLTARNLVLCTVFVNRSDYPSPVSSESFPHPHVPLLTMKSSKDLAWTGWKNSGRDVTLSRFGFEQFVKLKSHHIKVYPNKGVHLMK